MRYHVAGEKAGRCPVAPARYPWPGALSVCRDATLPADGQRGRGAAGKAVQNHADRVRHASGTT